MKLFERIKEIFGIKRVKALPTASLEIDKIVLMAVRENDPEKKLDILKNYSQDMNSESIVHIISNLPMQSRLKGIEIAIRNIAPFDLAELALKKLDYNGKIEVLDKYEYKLSVEDIYQLFNNIPPDQRSYALKKCSDRLDSSDIADIIQNYIPLYERLECLNLYSNQLDGYSIASIIKTLDTDRKIDALRLYEKEINRTDLYEIVCATETRKISDVLNVVYNKLTSKQIYDIIQYYIPNEKKLETLYKCCYKLDSSTISDIIKFVLPEEQKEEALISLQNRIKSNNIGEILQFCVRSLNALQKVQHNLDPEDIEYFKKNL